MEHEKTPPRVPVKLTGDQHKTLKAAADALGIGIGAYLRMAALERAKE